MQLGSRTRLSSLATGVAMAVCCQVGTGCVGSPVGDLGGTGSTTSQSSGGGGAVGGGSAGNLDGGSGGGTGGTVSTGSGSTVGTVGSGGAAGGTASGTGSTPGSGGVSPGTGGVPGVPGDLPLPRLSHDEYIQTVTDLVTEVIPSSAKSILSSVIPLTSGLPADALVTAPNEKHGGFSRDDQSEQQQYSAVPISVAVAVGQALTSSSSRISTVFGSCAKNGSVDSTCLQSFVKSFGQIALRHPLSDDDVTFYVGTAQSSPPSTTDLANVIAVMLASPRFLYRIESGDQQVSTNVYQLDAWELASRLSYYFWGTMPDATLRADAASGKLLTDDGYAAEVDRLMADPRADSTLRTFFLQWFWPLLEMPPLDSRASDPVFQAFAGANLPDSSLRDHMVNDVLDATSWVLDNGGSLADLLTNNLNFAKDADLAAIYGVTAWSGQGTPTALPPERVGLLARPAFLSTGTINTRPIMKGVFIRQTLLCDNIPPPPQNAANTPIVLGANQTTRDAIQALTEVSGTACAGCHKPLINPLGFASENFDGLGRTRAAQMFFDDAGNVTGSKAVDTTSVPGVVPGDPTMSNGLGDLTALLNASGKLGPCMAKRLFRFAFRRLETDGDADVLNALSQLASNGSLTQLFKGVALRPEFKQRVITQ